MAVVLYRPGISEMVKDVRCDMKICEGNEHVEAIESGEWFFSVEVAYAQDNAIAIQEKRAADYILMEIGYADGVLKDIGDIDDIEWAKNKLEKLQSLIDEIHYEARHDIRPLITKNIENLDRIIDTYRAAERRIEKQVAEESEALWTEMWNEVKEQFNN